MKLFNYHTAPKSTQRGTFETRKQLFSELELSEKPKFSYKKLSQSHFVLKKSHMAENPGDHR